MRVMTWNVENLFRPGGMAGVTDPVLYEQKLVNLAAMISAHRPDVVGLQEIGDPGALADLTAKLGARYPHVLVSEQFEPRHPIRVGALLRRGLRPEARDELRRFPPGSLTTVPQEEGPLAQMSRGALAFSADLDGESVRFVVVHLKSKRRTNLGECVAASTPRRTTDPGRRPQRRARFGLRRPRVEASVLTASR